MTWGRGRAGRAVVVAGAVVVVAVTAAGPVAGLGAQGGGAPAQPRGSAATHYKFAYSNTRTPTATWPRCGTITWAIDTTMLTRVKVNPARYITMTKAAVADLARYTGYRFAYQGTMTADMRGGENGFPGRTSKNVDVSIVFASRQRSYGPHYAPELVTYDAVGLGNTHVAHPWLDVGPPVALHGTIDRGAVTIDTAWVLLSRRLGHADDWYRSLIRHELGHVAALAHVRDARQMMGPTPVRVSGYQAGDIAGLTKLRKQPCASPPTPSTPLAVDLRDGAGADLSELGAADLPATLRWTVTPAGQAEQITRWVITANDSRMLATLPGDARQWTLTADMLTWGDGDDVNVVALTGYDSAGQDVIATFLSVYR